MAEANDSTTTQTVHASDLYPQLQHVGIFAHSSPEDLACLGDVEIIQAQPDTNLFRDDEIKRFLWLLLDGQIRIMKTEKDGSTTLLATLTSGESFGEVQLLTRMDTKGVSCEVDKPTTLIRVSEESFWRLMTTCEFIRNGILQNMTRRLQAYQALTLHKEKLISLGTLAAGLMHELNNPGAAARRASTQLRENLKRLQKSSLCFINETLSPEQIQCLRQLQEQVMTSAPQSNMTSLDQSDKEEELADWLEGAGVEGAWELAPTLTAIGLSQQELQCARSAFQDEELSDALNWLGALSSSMQLVGTIEESITRVSELVSAVKKYSYEDKAEQHKIDIPDSLRSTMTILGHKFREKEIRIEKSLTPDLPILLTRGTGLNQVWTNLLDNALDASPQKGVIRIRTWRDANSIFVGIADQGSGISEENRKHIFEPFFTTKGVGVGTGLGLDIAHRIVQGHYHGEISFTSEPGKTEFVVRLPIEA